MWIASLDVRQIPPFRDDHKKPIEFCRGFNLIRGANGIGKTTVLESLALIGHLPLFESLESTPKKIGECNIVCTLHYEEHDLLAMRAVIARLPQLVDADSPFGREWLDPQALGELQSTLQGLEANASVRFGLSVQRRQAKVSDLKEILSSEFLMKADVKLHVAALGDAACLRFLIGLARPEVSGYEADLSGDLKKRKPSTWFTTPRARLLREAEGGTPGIVPGFVGYFHSDMYRWGVGNDVRESPKELNHKSMSRMVCERFGLFDDYTDPEGARVRNSKLVAELWKRIISPEGGKTLSKVWARRDEFGLTSVDVEISTEQTNIVSSGENQALFLLLWAISHDATNSMLFVDEPELHLSPGAAHRAIEFLQALARTRNTQVICATHAAVVPRGVRGKKNEFNRMFYLEGPDKDPIDGEAAVEAVSRDFQETIDELIRALRPSQEH